MKEVSSKAFYKNLERFWDKRYEQHGGKWRFGNAMYYFARWLAVHVGDEPNYKNFAVVNGDGRATVR